MPAISKSRNPQKPGGALGRMFRRKVAPGIEIRLFEMQRCRSGFRGGGAQPRLPAGVAALGGLHAHPEDMRRFIRRAQLQYESSQGPQVAIWVDGAFAGSLGCHAIDWANRNSSIGYWIDAAHQGKGLITRCCAAMLDYLFEELALHRVEIRCGTGNHRSCAIPERLGFTREGVIREAEWVKDRWVDLVVWGILEHDWRHRE